MTQSTRLETHSHMTSKLIMLNYIICDLNTKLNVDSLILFENHFSGGPNIYADWLEHYISCRTVLMVNQFWFIRLHSVAGSKLQFKVGFIYIYIYIYIYKCSVTQSCQTLCNCMKCSLPGFSVYEIYQARILEWVAMLPSGDIPGPVTEPASLVSPALEGELFTIGLPGKLIYMYNWVSLL